MANPPRQRTRDSRHKVTLNGSVRPSRFCEAGGERGGITKKAASRRLST
ncbi:hypothetical protein [Lysobacter gummosus]